MRWIDGRIDDPIAALGVRRVIADREVSTVVAELIEDVRTRGDAALLDHACRFDSPEVTSVVVTSAEFDQAEQTVSEEDRAALELAIDRVMRFHEAQVYYLTETMDRHEGGESRFEGVPQTSYSWSEETDHGGYLGQRLIPVAAAGVYVPGGRATYPSSVVMNVGPANVAMVPHVSVATPSRRDGSIAPAVLLAARLMHVDQVVRVGGASAVAALALGTESVRRVDVVAGPGNRYVNEAKRQLWGTVGLDGYAGPSEVCVLADATTNARWAAADLLTQVEHAEDNAGFLVCTDEVKAREILVEVDRLVADAPRGHVIEAALQRYGMVFVTRDRQQASEIINAIAPEHLSLAVQDAEDWLPLIENAGCILIGEWTPESAGDFVAGPSHTLPTSRAARFGSPLNVMHFLKFQSVIRLGEGDLAELRPAIERFAQMEDFPAHGQGAAVRFESP